jgi:tricorn protease
MHGADWPAVRERYRPFLPHVGHRDDLNYLLAMVASELVVSHMGVGGGDTARPRGVAVGLLGADLEAADGYYRVAHIYSGENWNPDLRAPLTEPGVDVSEGDYILAVNGRPATSDRSIYGLFEKTADRQTVLLVNGRPEQDEARSVTVVPVSSDRGLRRRGWIEDNRRTVDRLTGGRVAYVYMPNTAGAGYTSFNRDYFAHLDREAVIIDERFNGGGSLADYVVDLMARTPLAYPTPRDGKPFATPNTTIAGPKVMLINEYAGSG